ncbi:hypothetical protein [Streptomyces sp. ME02-6978.2a]|uniref:hypothetical protein n=1 Tax=Streptomyces sp. ME02-6978.2a TaxID=462922 RepID=UPI0029AC4817|nr:hypothetical protein [Streptomyces sp. ME02-6978.2a]MDX3360588.1 hypothetical protein [Streptomyces sp. ME02-6978.2a]
MLEHYLKLGDVEIANHARLNAYVGSVGTALTSVTACGCETFTAELVGDSEYTDPATDAAPWYDPDLPESAAFAGLMVLSVDGLDDYPVTRSVSTAVTGGAALGPARVQPRTITVTGILLGSSCCGVEYGLAWLSEALTGCTGDGCGGDCLTFYNCCPGEDVLPEEFEARHARTLRRVALTSPPTVTARAGDGCTSGQCSTGADILTVEFVLTAATPWKWTAPVPLLDVAVPTDDGSECVTWCVHDPKAPPPAPPACLDLVDSPDCAGGVLVEFADAADCDLVWPDQDSAEHPCASCRLAKCPSPDDLCNDPSCRTPAPPVPLPPATCFCHALAVNSEAYELDLSSWPRWFGSVPLIEVHAGSKDLRHVTVSIFKRTAVHTGLTCAEVAVMERCNPAAVYEVAYVPAGGVMTLDGQVGRASVACLGGCENSPDVYGQDGGPLQFPLLDCDTYCVEISADAFNTPADDASVRLSLSGRGY